MASEFSEPGFRQIYVIHFETSSPPFYFEPSFQHNPDAVLSELTRALVSKGIPLQQKGYILRGKVRDASGMSKLSFELEVCRIPNLNVVGIRRKRLKGDAWCYKKVCEEVLRMAAVSKS